MAFHAAVGFAQPLQIPTIDSFSTAEVYVKQIDTKDGLSQGMINDFLFDAKGYLWVATKDGLNRYDGYHFKVFRHSPNSPNSIADNMVNHLFLDKRNRLWVELDQDRIDCFDPKTEKFIHLNNDSFINVYLHCPTPKKIYNDLNGDLITPSLDGFDTLFVPKQSPNFLKAKLTYMGLSNVFDLLVKAREQHKVTRPTLFMPNGDIWLNSYDSAFLIKNHATADSIVHTYNLDFDGSPYHWTKMVASKDQKDVYVLRGDLILHFNQASNQFVPVLKIPPIKQPENLLPQIVLFIDAQNALWCVRPNGTCVRIDIPHKTFTILTAKDNDKGLLSMGNNALVDSNGNIWVGTGGFGLLKIPAMATVFKLFQDKDTTKLNEFWLERTITPNNKAEYDDFAKRRWLDLMAHKQLKNLKSSPTSLALDDDGYFWRASYDAVNKHTVIDKYSALTFEEIRAVTSPPINDVWFGTPLFLSNNNELWFGSRPVNDTVWLHHLNKATNKVDRYLFPIKGVANTYRFILDWYQQKNGLFWFGTSQGLFSFETQTHAWQHFENHPGNPSTLSSNMIYCIWPDPVEPDRYLWIGTNGGGLNKMDMTNGTFANYTTNDGLPNNVVYSILSDSHNNLWLGTNSGLCLFNPQSLSTHNFTTEDGLPGDEFNRYEFSKSSTTGELCFGGVNGSFHFNPNDYYKKENSSEIVINQLRIFNKEVELNKPIEYTKKLVLNYNQSMITFGFSVLDFSNPQNNRFKYKLAGYQDDWIEGNNNPEATFTNLSPGKYTLQVLGCNSHGIWSTIPTSLVIKIRPPWWGTWWFKLLLALIFIALLYLLYRYRLRQAVKMEKLRNQIAQDLHDEIGSTLSSISLYTTVIQNISSGLPVKTNQILDKISNSATSMTEAMNDIVWTISANNDTFDKVVYRMRAFAVTMAECTNIALSFEADDIAESLKLSMLQRKNIYLIYKEALNNAVKHAACSHVDVKIVHQFKQLRITVKDDGKGFETNSHDKYNLGGNGLSGMYARAKECNAKVEIMSVLGQGTTVTLVLQL